MPAPTFLATGTFANPDGSMVATGTVTFTPTGRATPSSTVVDVRPIVAPIVAGAVSQQLVATGGSYLVTEQVAGGIVAQYSIPATGANIDLSTVSVPNVAPFNPANWQNAWSSTVTYQVGQMVSRSGSSYVALLPSLNQDPATASAYWALVAVGNPVAAPGPPAASDAAVVHNSGNETVTGVKSVDWFAVKTGGKVDVSHRSFGGAISGDWSTALNAAIAAMDTNGILLIPDIQMNTSGHHVLTGSQSMQGKGDGWPGGAGSEIICTAAGAGIEVQGGNGGEIENVTINANHVATNPLKRTVNGSGSGGFKRFSKVQVWNSAGRGWQLLGPQNDSFYDCQGAYNAGTDLYISYGTGGTQFYNWESFGHGGYALQMDDSTHYAPYPGVLDIQFWGGRLEHYPNDPQIVSVAFIRNASDISFHRTLLLGGTNLTGPVVDLDMAASDSIDFSTATIGAGRTVPWAAGSYLVGATVTPTAANGHVYRCTTAGTTASTQPTWPTGAGASVADGTVVWTEAGPSGGLGFICLQAVNRSGPLQLGRTRFLAGDTSLYIPSGNTPIIISTRGMVDNTANGPLSAAGMPEANSLLAGRTGPWITPTMLNGWTNVGGGYPTLAYRITADGDVEIRGVIHGGTVTSGSSVICQTKVGYRAISPNIYPTQHVMTSGGDGFVLLDAFGNLQVTERTAGTATAGVWLDGMRFPIT